MAVWCAGDGLKARHLTSKRQFRRNVAGGEVGGADEFRPARPWEWRKCTPRKGRWDVEKAVALFREGKQR